MPREIADPTPCEGKGQDGYEEHPAWGMISATRGTIGGPGGGAVLFGSDMKHGSTVTVRIREAIRRRDLGRDWVHAKSRVPVVEVEMSEAQWASFLSSMNMGDGVPCTIRAAHGEWDVPGVPHEPRLAESMEEVRTAAERAIEKLREAFKAVEEKPNKGNIRNLRFAIEHLPANMVYAAETLSEHAENVVQRTRFDIEAMVATAAQERGLDPADLGGAPALLPGDEEG